MSLIEGIMNRLGNVERRLDALERKSLADALQSEARKAAAGPTPEPTPEPSNTTPSKPIAATPTKTTGKTVKTPDNPAS